MLTPRNYHTWKADVMVFLTCENALEIVLGNEAPPPANASFAIRESYQKRLGHATGMVYSSVEPSIRAIINKLPDRNPARIWTALGEKFNTAASRSGRMAIRKRFQFTTMKEGTSVQAYIATLTTIQQELVGTPDEIPDESLISHLLQNLSKSYKTLVDIITHRPADDETVDSITTELIEYEISNALYVAQVGSNTNTAGTVVDGHALTAETDFGNPKQPSGRGRGYGRGRGRGRGQGKGRGNGRKPYERPVGRCFHCTKEGHRASECSLKQKADKIRRETLDGWKSQKTATANYAGNDNTEDSTEMHAYSATSEAGSDSWLIDSGASHHLTGNNRVIRDFRLLPKPIPVRIANGATCLATGSGSIQFNLHCGLLLTVKVLYVPDFGTLSLLSVDALNESGYEVIFRLGSCLVKSDSITEPQIIGKRQVRSRTCTLLGTVLAEAQANCAISTSKTPEDLDTWHRRFAHMNLADLRLLLPREAYTEKKAESACLVCAKTKAKEQFQRKAPAARAEKALELIHSDLCGPISPLSQSGCRYYVLFIDVTLGCYLTRQRKDLMRCSQVFD